MQNTGARFGNIIFSWNRFEQHLKSWSRLKWRTAPAQIRCLNRLIFERNEIHVDDGHLSVLLPSSDPRTRHVKKIIRAGEGATLRIGVVDAGKEVCLGLHDVVNALQLTFS